MLYAEHEFNASTFAARVIAGTGSDFYSAVTGAIGALRGPKHGGANEVAIEIVQRYATPDEAEEDIRERLAAEGDRDRLRPPRLHHLRSPQRDHQRRSPASSASTAATPTCSTLPSASRR